MNKLTQSQSWNLEILKKRFNGNWFVQSQCYGMSIKRVRFVLDTLHEKGYLNRELNPERSGLLEDDFFRYRINSERTTSEQ